MTNKKKQNKTGKYLSLLKTLPAGETSLSAGLYSRFCVKQNRLLYPWGLWDTRLLPVPPDTLSGAAWCRGWPWTLGLLRVCTDRFLQNHNPGGAKRNGSTYTQPEGFWQYTFPVECAKCGNLNTIWNYSTSKIMEFFSAGVNKSSWKSILKEKGISRLIRQLSTFKRLMNTLMRDPEMQ